MCGGMIILILFLIGDMIGDIEIMESVFNFESASFGDLALAASGLGEDILAVVAGNH